jgi:hypothetical protein
MAGNKCTQLSEILVEFKVCHPYLVKDLHHATVVPYDKLVLNIRPVAFVIRNPKTLVIDIKNISIHYYLNVLHARPYW